MANENLATLPQKSQIVLNEVFVEGKITAIEQPQNSEYTYYTFSLKAKDEYSMPALVQVSQSAKDRPFARQGDFIRIKCELSGFPRKSGGRTYITNVLTFAEVY
jgi:hypothetical protein